MSRTPCSAKERDELAKRPDTDYLYISSRLKALDKNMLTREKLGRLTSLKTGEEAVKLLGENGWGDFDPDDLAALEEQIDAQRESVFELLYRYAPDRLVIDVFRLKYDGHNLKALIKAQALGLDARPLLSGAGAVPPLKLEAMLREKNYHELNETLRDAVIEAVDLLARTGDPQMSDMLVDRAVNVRMLSMAKQSESEFLIGYVKLSIDLSNLRVVTRAALCGKGFDYLRRAVLPGGTISPDRLTAEMTPDLVQGLFASKDLSAAAQAAAQALGGGGLAALDMACDNALIHYVRSARLIAFGEAHIISYLVAREAELVSVRTIMSGRRSGLSEEQIIERLRVSYV